MRPEVEAPLRPARRHLFTPDGSLEDAYSTNLAVITKQPGDETVNSVSTAWRIAEMLGQAVDTHEGGVAGLDVLEIGPGGYNAALLRVVGDTGSVTTVHIHGSNRRDSTPRGTGLATR